MTSLEKSIRIAPYLKRIVSERVMPDPTHRIFNWKRNRKLCKCIGLIGPRGSGKSDGASGLAILDYLIPGYSVISNMSIMFGVRLGDYVVGYKSQPLDKMEFLHFDIEQNTAVVVDEVNIEFSEARRSMTNRNLIFNKIMQQLRKRHLNIIYTVQHEMWIDNRLRWQTDIFVKCRDECLKPGGFYLPYEFGEFIEWRVYDMTGVLGRGTYAETGRPVVESARFPGKMFWNTFNTDLIQGEDELTYGKASVETYEVKRSADIQKMDWLMAPLTAIVANANDNHLLNERNEVSEIDLSSFLSQNCPELREEVYSWDEVKKLLRDVTPKIFTRQSGGQTLYNFTLLRSKYYESLTYLKV